MHLRKLLAKDETRTAVGERGERYVEHSTKAANHVSQDMVDELHVATRQGFLHMPISSKCSAEISAPSRAGSVASRHGEVAQVDLANLPSSAAEAVDGASQGATPGCSVAKPVAGVAKTVGQ